MTLVIDVFRGSKAQYVKAQKLEQLDGYGTGSSMKKTEVERLLVGSSCRDTCWSGPPARPTADRTRR